MTLRLRLTLWYGSLCALALAVVGFVAYSVSVREQYLALDRTLALSARLVENSLVAYGRSFSLGTDISRPTKDGVVMVLRGYSPAGELMYISPSDPGLPRTKPIESMLMPSPPAYLEVLPWPLQLGQVAASKNAAFGTVRIEQQRWRRYVVQVTNQNKVLAYVEALSPLEQLDSASLKLANLLTRLAGISVVAVLGVGWLLAGSALRPVNRLNRAARAIAQSRDLAQRVKTGGNRDELGRLALTFNEMLGSLEAAWQSQQRFVGDASHELRAPLTVMRGNLELLRRHPQLGPEEREEMLSDIDREATRLSRLVEDLLLLANSDAGITLHRQPVNLHHTALEALRDTRRLAPEHDVKLDVQGGPFMVPGDPNRLKQLLLILLDNAAKYSPPGAQLTMLLRRDEQHVTLDVQDQGPGIPDEALPHIFERFYRADRARGRDPGGAGLGLAIAQWIATQLEAQLFVPQTGPGGTTFRLILPALPTQAAEAPRSPVPASGSTG